MIGGKRCGCFFLPTDWRLKEKHKDLCIITLDFNSLTKTSIYWCNQLYIFDLSDNLYWFLSVLGLHMCS